MRGSPHGLARGRGSSSPASLEVKNMTMKRYGHEVEEELTTSADLKKKALVYDRNDLGKLKICSNETLKHFTAKSVLMFELIRMHHKAVCEIEIAGIGKLDVFDITTKTIYELESEQYAAKSWHLKEKYQQVGVDIVIITLHGLSENLHEIQTYLRSFVRPD
jgi:hypothetical protein